MTDHQLITEGYDQIIKTAFAQFYQATVLAKTPEEKAEAERRFQTGIGFAREVRDRAFAILPPA
jgi:hypothetical protein